MAKLSRTGFLGGLALAATLATGCQFTAIPRLNAADQAMAGQVKDAMAQLAKVPATADRFDFVLVGDSRGGLDVLKREMAEIDRLNPAFVIYSGDLVGEGTEQEYKDGLAVLRTIKAPVFPAVGNHERRNDGIKWYYQYFGKDLDYSFDYGNWRFVSVDNSTGAVTDEQLAWMQAKLAGPQRKIVFAHMPPPLGIWFVHPFRGKYKDFMKTVEAAKVDACLFGHIHIFDKAEKRGIRYVVSGGGGAPLYRLPIFNSREGGAFYHYVVGHAAPTGVTFEVKRLGQVAPQFDTETVLDTEDPGEAVSDF
ncbi:MAG: metallophosphoesterase [Candidatus Sericytochromatia bacterium]|nr:metallophosphoesterase [Candidatus Tanganyikabacteria bacterium]